MVHCSDSPGWIYSVDAPFSVRQPSETTQSRVPRLAASAAHGRREKYGEGENAADDDGFATQTLTSKACPGPGLDQGLADSGLATRL
jgi:hypothetical protein